MDIHAQAEKWTERRRFMVMLGCQIAYAFNGLFALFALLLLYRLALELNDWRAMLGYPAVMICFPLRKMWWPKGE